MNLFLWIVQAILAAMFALAGRMKVTQPKEKLAPRPDLAPTCSTRTGTRHGARTRPPSGAGRKVFGRHGFTVALGARTQEKLGGLAAQLGEPDLPITLDRLF